MEGAFARLRRAARGEGFPFRKRQFGAGVLADSPIEIIFQKKRFEGNNAAPSSFQLLGAPDVPPSPSALFCPAPAPPCAGLFLSYVRYIFKLGRAGSYCDC